MSRVWVRECSRASESPRLAGQNIFYIAAAWSKVYTGSTDHKLPWVSLLHSDVCLCFWQFDVIHHVILVNVGLIMVIELIVSGVQFGLKSRGLNRVICNCKFDFRPQLHDTKFNYHFIISILKSYHCKNWNWNFPKNNILCLFFPAIWLVSLVQSWNLIGCHNSMFQSDWLKKRCDLEPK
jgi:hypothetical protein